MAIIAQAIAWGTVILDLRDKNFTVQLFPN